jgi:hypothetical protein
MAAYPCPDEKQRNRQTRGHPRPLTRAAVATWRRIVATQGVSQTSHQRGCIVLGISRGDRLGKCRIGR